MFLPGTRIEIVNAGVPRGRARAVLFDFDGTLSLIREGWPDVMIPMMVEILRQTPTRESPEETRAAVEEFVMRLNGKQTIYQMIQLADEVRRRGGTPREPLEYKHEYLDRLWQRIKGRVDRLREPGADAEPFTVPGSEALLEALRARGLPLYLASGTDLDCVRNELAALKLDRYFGDRVFGALDQYQNFSKRMIIDRAIADFGLGPGELVSFGDGYVEIEETKKVGGIAIAVASDEVHRTGINAWKRDRLLRAGADAVIPDYRDLDALLGWLFP